MKQDGIIISTEENRAKVMLQRQSSCGDCKACRFGSDDMSMEIDAINSINAKVGDHVKVNMDHQNFLSAAFIAYALPLFALIGGIFIGNRVLCWVGMTQYKDIGAGLFGFLLTAVTFGMIRTKEKSLRLNKRFVPIVTDIIHE